LVSHQPILIPTPQVAGTNLINRRDGSLIQRLETPFANDHPRAWISLAATLPTMPRERE
jgi:uncharacterized Zn-finger protein